jgi:hypothetical protein
MTYLSPYKTTGPPLAKAAPQSTFATPITERNCRVSCPPYRNRATPRAHKGPAVSGAAFGWFIRHPDAPDDCAYWKVLAVMTEAVFDIDGGRTMLPSADLAERARISQWYARKLLARAVADGWLECVDPGGPRRVAQYVFPGYQAVMRVGTTGPARITASSGAHKPKKRTYARGQRALSAPAPYENKRKSARAPYENAQHGTRSTRGDGADETGPPSPNPVASRDVGEVADYYPPPDPDSPYALAARPVPAESGSAPITAHVDPDTLVNLSGALLDRWVRLNAHIVTPTADPDRKEVT